MNVFDKDKIFTGAFFTPFAYLIGGPAGVISMIAGTFLSTRLQKINKSEMPEEYKKYLPKTADDLKELQKQRDIAWGKIKDKRKSDKTIKITKEDMLSVYCNIPHEYEYDGYESTITFMKNLERKDTKKIYLYNNAIKFLELMESFEKEFDCINYYCIDGGANPWLFFCPSGKNKRGLDYKFDHYYGFVF